FELLAFMSNPLSSYTPARHSFPTPRSSDLISGARAGLLPADCLLLTQCESPAFVVKFQRQNGSAEHRVSQDRRGATDKNLGNLSSNRRIRASVCRGDFCLWD